MYANQGRKDCASPAGERRCKESYCKGGLMHRCSGHRYSGSVFFNTCSPAQRDPGTPACRAGSMSLQKHRGTRGASLINCTARQELRGILCLRRLFMKRKLLSVFLSLAMVLTMMPVFAMADTSVGGGYPGCRQWQ